MPPRRNNIFVAADGGITTWRYFEDKTDFYKIKIRYAGIKDVVIYKECGVFTGDETLMTVAKSRRKEYWRLDRPVYSFGRYITKEEWIEHRSQEASRVQCVSESEP